MGENSTQRQRGTDNSLFDKEAVCYANRLYKGIVSTKKKNISSFVSPDLCSLHNSVGKDALQALLNLAKFIISLHDETWPSHETLFNQVNGQAYLAPSVDLNVYVLPSDLCTKYFNQDAEHPWPPSKSFGVGETRIPDVISTCTSQNGIIDKNVIVGEVKSSVDLGVTTKNQVKLFRQAWKQTLLGLVNSDATYGLLFHPREAQLFYLKIEDQKEGTTQKLYTYTEVFSFRNDKPAKFDVDQLILLLKRIIAIFLRLPDV